MICSSGKEGYTGKGILNAIVVYERIEMVKLTGYLCTKCQQWHLTEDKKKGVTKRKGLC